MQPTAWDFQNRLTAILNAAKSSGKVYVDVRSDQLQTQPEDHSNVNRGMSVCFEVMKKLMRSGDSILDDTSMGKDGRLMVRYIV